MKKILLIDDDPDVITVLQILLKKKGYQVATASCSITGPTACPVTSAAATAAAGVEDRAGQCDGQ